MIRDRIRTLANASVLSSVLGSVTLLVVGCSQNDVATASAVQQIVCSQGSTLVGLVSAPGQPISASGKTQAYIQEACALAGAAVATAAQVQAVQVQASASGTATPVATSVQIDPTKVSQ